MFVRSYGSVCDLQETGRVPVIKNRSLSPCFLEFLMLYCYGILTKRLRRKKDEGIGLLQDGFPNTAKQ